MGRICLNGISIPSDALPYWQVHQRGQGLSDTSSTCVEVTAVVSGFTRPISRLSSDAPTTTEAFVGPIWQTALSDGNRTATISRLETIKHRQQAEGISSKASQLLAAGWSKSTNSTYESAWKRWDSWCSER